MTVHPAAQGSSRRARLLFVHAHPDDETLTTGVTMAAYAAQGHDVHLLTCTLGEEGEVIPAELAHCGSDRDDSLGYTRRGELRAAMAVLGVQHAVLGEDPARGVASRYRDSGMVGTSGAEHPDAFAAADVDEAAAMVAAHIRALRPDVVVTYDRQGGYSHPDHVQAHRVTMSALSALSALSARSARSAPSARTASAELDAMAAPVAYCILTPESWASQDRLWLQENVSSTSSTSVVLQQDDPYPPSVVRDEVVTHVVDEPALVEKQSRALAQHKTQVVVYDGYYTLSNHVAARLSGREGFARLDLATGDLVPAAHGAPWHAGLLIDLEGR
ncbi:MAG TPA: N-acetyl-1-D-myo-inositol-2-amino-2-deoxy-alpha-D-glucopyranoside deacetylase [Dermatophilaceae bacterium]